MSRSWSMLFTGLLALTLLASFVWKSALWGLSAWGAVSPLVALACAIVIAAQFFLKSTGEAFDRIPRLRSRAARVLLTAAVAVALLWLLRSRHELWGERFTLGAAIERGPYRPGAPLATVAQWTLYRFMNAVFLTSEDSILTFFSIAAGTIYAVLAVRLAGFLFGAKRTGGENWLASAVLLSGGFVALFFGFGGNVPLALVAALAFITEALRFLRGKCPLALPAVLLAVAILSHLSAAYLVPAFVFLVARGTRLMSSRRESIVAGGLFVAFLAAAEVVFVRFGVRSGLSTTLSLNLSLDRASFSNALNTLLVIGPASVTAVFLLVKNARRRPADLSRIDVAGVELAFLTVCAISALAAFVIGSELPDGGLRWHLLATTGPAFSIYALWALKGEFAEAAGFKKIAATLVLIGVFQTLPLVLVDAIPRAAEKRLLDLPLAPGRAEMIIADFALEKGDLDKARAWYVASLNKNRANETAALSLGRIAMKQEEYAEAITHFLDAHELKPREPRYRFELAEALIAKRWFPEAIAQLETLTVAYPDSVAFWRRLGFARNNGNRYESAIAAYEKALALESGNEENLRNLVSALLNRAAELQTAKEYDDARALYDRVIEMYPQDWRAYNNLAIIEMNQGRLMKAHEILDGALRLHPYETSLHFNMGIVLEKLGRNKEALAHMRGARDLDPVYSKAPMHIERLERKLGIWKQAQGDSQRSPLNNP
jgi:tetratricopeptide (TPR) repeat protein